MSRSIWALIVVLSLAAACGDDDDSNGQDGGAAAAGGKAGTAGRAGAAGRVSEAGAGAAGKAGAAGRGGSGPAGGGAAAAGGGRGGAGAGAGAGAAGRGGSGGATAGAGGSAGAAGTGNGGLSSTNQWVLGYYTRYQLHLLEIADIDWSGLTHVAFAPMTVNANHSLSFDFSSERGTGEADAKALAKAAHDHNVKALLMLGGANAGANIAAAATAANRGAFVNALIQALSTLGYDGIDLDWEDNVNLDDLVALAKALRAAKADIVLSYPGGPINPNIGGVDPKLVTLAESLDRFNVQTYYPATAFAGSGWSSWFSSPIDGETPSTPVSIEDTLKRYADAGIPKSKLGMGISFYAICYTGGITGPHQSTNGSSQKIVGGDNDYPLSTMFAAGSTLDKNQSARKFDAEAKVPYLSLATAVNDSGCKASTQYIAYEDEESIVAKGQFSKSNGYGGIIIWTIQEGWLPANAVGGRARNALFQALKQAFID
jgi:hypothetical protein